MKIVIVGAGASGTVAAINYKRNHTDDDVLIIEQLDKPLKKILATGNGKCNLGNDNIIFSNYNNENFAKKIITGYDYKDFFESISIRTKSINGFVYPVSESAVSVRDALLKEIDKLNIKINLDEKLIDYKVSNKIEIITNKNKYIADKLILSGGLMSSPKLGSDGSVIDILSNHNYKINPINPGLCPIITKEKTKEIDGIRVKSNASIIQNNKILYKESGEVLFREHGLSGIVIFNLASKIARIENKDIKISIDLLPDYPIDELKTYAKSKSIDDLLLAFVNPKLSNYLIKRFKKTDELINALKNLEFSFEKLSGFEFSQVSVGGIDVNEVDLNLMSNKENNVYIIGELLNIDGPCGGYNLTWAFASAFKATKK